jgi:hypothetical protein
MHAPREKSGRIREEARCSALLPKGMRRTNRTSGKNGSELSPHYQKKHNQQVCYDKIVPNIS